MLDTFYKAFKKADWFSFFSAVFYFYTSLFIWVNYSDNFSFLDHAFIILFTIYFVKCANWFLASIFEDDEYFADEEIEEIRRRLLLSSDKPKNDIICDNQ